MNKYFRKAITMERKNWNVCLAWWEGLV